MTVTRTTVGSEIRIGRFSCGTVTRKFQSGYPFFGVQFQKHNNGELMIIFSVGVGPVLVTAFS